jgi:hypothetical protein
MGKRKKSNARKRTCVLFLPLSLSPSLLLLSPNTYQSFSKACVSLSLSLFSLRWPRDSHRLVGEKMKTKMKSLRSTYLESLRGFFLLRVLLPCAQGVQLAPTPHLFAKSGVCHLGKGKGRETDID